MMMRVRSLGILAFVVAALGMSSQASADVNLLVNGSFETGDFTGWTQNGNTGFTGVTGNFNGVDPSDGSFQAYFGPVGSLGGISQNVATLATHNYAIDFDLYNFGGTPSEYKIEFGSTVLVDAVNSDAFPYTPFHFVATGDAGVTTLTALNFQQNPSYFLLDNVSVTDLGPSATPEPSTLAIGGVSGLLALAYGLRRKRAA